MIKRYKAHFLGLALIAVWALLAFCWLFSDGHPRYYGFGWFFDPFLAPGAGIVSHVKGGVSNADMPFVVVVSWSMYSAVVFAIAQIIHVISRRRQDTRA